MHTRSDTSVEISQSAPDPSAQSSERHAAAAARGELRPLDIRVMLLWRISWLVQTLFLSAAAAVALNWLELQVPAPAVVAAIFAIGIILTIVWPVLQFRHWRFAVRGTDVFITRGVLWRTTSVVPHARIQHVDTHQGPLERAVGLASVVMFTAGTVGAAITVPGLAQAQAEELREWLAQLSGSDDAV